MKRLPMRKIREALRLKAAGLTHREIGASLGVGRSTVGDYLERAKQAGLAWPVPEGLDDDALEQRLFASPGASHDQSRPQPDWAHVHRELRRKSVTLMLLWEEYRAAYPDGYGYSQFCMRYRQWEGRLVPTMRQRHVAGEKMFVDYAGQTIDIVDGATGEVHACQLFIAVLGASSYTYAEAMLRQTLPDWCSSHERACRFFGGVPGQIVSDNLKAGNSRFSGNLMPYSISISSLSIMSSWLIPAWINNSPRCFVSQDLFSTFLYPFTVNRRRKLTPDRRSILTPPPRVQHFRPKWF